MEIKNSDFPTEELLKLLNQSDSFEQFCHIHADKIADISTPDYLELLLGEHKMTKQQVIEQANLERSSGYQIFSGIRNPRRDTLLRIAIAMRLTLPETQRLLKVAQRGELYPKNRRDAAIIYCIEHRRDMIDAELLLQSIGEPSLK